MEADDSWMAQNTFREYNGEWIAVLDKKIIAHSKDLDEVIDQIKGCKALPTLMKIDGRLRIL